MALRGKHNALLVLVIGIAFLVGYGVVVSDPRTDEPLHVTLPGGKEIELFPCPFRVLTGVPCPVCGISRSCALTLRGDLAGGFRAHPLGPVLVAGAVAAVVWALGCLLRRDRQPIQAGDPIRRSHLPIGALLLLVVFAAWAVSLARHFGIISW